MTQLKVQQGACETNSEFAGVAAKSAQVKSVFENVPHYQNSRYVDIRLRTEAAKIYAAHVDWHELLDIGCGDGSISVPLMTPSSRLTLLDLSSNMLATAAGRIPEEFVANVKLRNENFMTASFAPRSFDLIVTVGVVAHVESPEEFVAKIVGLLKPRGSLIIEFTDALHFVGRVSRFFGWLKELVAPAKYSTNRLGFSRMSRIFADNGLRLESVFRYATIPIPGVERLVDNRTLYKIVKSVFGEPGENRNAFLGNEYICFLRAE